MDDSAYTFSGKSIKSLKLSAKKFSKKSKISYKKALDLTAKKAGYKSWKELITRNNEEKSSFFKNIYSLKNDPKIKKEYAKFLEDFQKSDNPENYRLFAICCYNFLKLAKRNKYKPTKDNLDKAFNQLLSSSIGANAFLPKNLPDNILHLFMDAFADYFENFEIENAECYEKLLSIVSKIKSYQLNAIYYSKISAKDSNFLLKRYYDMLVWEDNSRRSEVELITDINLNNIFDEQLKVKYKFRKF